MLAMLGIGVGLRYWQEARADDAAAALLGMIRLHATVLRDGAPVELPVERLVPGDVVRLAAGDMVPADVRLVAAKDLFVSQAALTGESFPVEKFAHAGGGADGSPLDLPAIAWLGTSVASGTAEAVVVGTGRDTLLGGVADALGADPVPTAFDAGLARFTWLMVGFVLVMVPVVFLVNGLARGDWGGALFFALAVAVGLTPEMLPMIVSVCLSRGALAMAGRQVIVKRLDAIQNLGAMDVLCTDKTGTLTLDRIILERHCDVRLREDAEVLRLAWLNSHFQTGLRNLLDRAILDHAELRERVPHEGYAKLDEIPFDFERRVMSVVVSTPAGGRLLVCKGAPEAGVREGRKVFVNILKYVRMGASSNFGNMLSVLAASVFLPYLPMTPLQILANNLLYDCSQVPIPTDDVDPELIARPRPWALEQISRFILLVGPVSSLFDLVTFAVLWHAFGCHDPARAPLFHTGWFVESLLTQTLVIHVIRTDRIPFLESRASRALAATTAAVMLVGIWLPGSPLGPFFGFVPLPAAWWPVLAATVVAYLAVTHGVKMWLVRRGWID